MNAIRRPKSFFWLILGGSLLVAAPALVAMAVSLMSLSRFDEQSLQRLMAIELAIAIVASIALAGMLTVLIVRPLREVDRTLRHLGSGEFNHQISIQGTRDLVQLGKRLKWLRRRLMQVEDQKLDFVRHISHELKTPLTTIREGSELLLDESGQRLDPESAEIAEIMRDSTLALEKLITDLLQFGRTEAPSRVLPEYEEVDLGQLLRTVLGKHAIATYAKRLKLESRLEPASLFGHRDQLQTVIDNLLSNAIKYSPDDGTIMVRSGTTDDGVFVSVRDSGPGLTREEREQVFEPFFRGSAPVKGHVKGTGLGLAIARQYVDAHEGRIEFLDLVDGAHVQVVLPARHSPQVSAAT